MGLIAWSAPTLVACLALASVQDSTPGEGTTGTVPPDELQEAEAPEEDPWALQARLPRGPERVAAILASLAPARMEPLQPRARLDRLQVGFAAFEHADERFAADDMLALAEALYALDPAPWSAFCLEGALRRGHGRYDEADAVLTGLQERLGPSIAPATLVELLQRRAIVAAGAGALERERELLGPALVRGGRDARQILGLRALARGDRQEAATLFGALLIDPPGEDGTAPQDRAAWALRGWGLALLPASNDALTVEPDSTAGDEP